MEKEQSVEKRVREWLRKNGYDYEIRVYQPGEAIEDCAERDKETISIPSVVKDADLFMEQFVDSFKQIHEITILKTQRK